jgi:CRISPR-associated protein Csy1
MEYNGLTALLADYVAGREAKAKLEVEDKAEIDKFDNDADEQRKATQDNKEQLADLELTLAAKRQKLVRPFIANWLTNAATLAKQLQMVTHAIKFTHSDITTKDSCSFYSPGGATQPEGMLSGILLSTGSLVNPTRDLVGNAAVMNVANFLQMGHEGKTLLEHIEQGDLSPLRPFAQDENQLAEWFEGFKQVLSGNELSSHKLAKQLYFPIGNGQYHLLAPIYSSSLAHALYGRIGATRYPDEIKLVRKAKKEGIYNGSPVIDYPDTAVRTFGGTKPQNVSQLNNSQHGKSFLLSCAPPNWEVRSKPPLGVKSVFSRNHFGLRVRKEVWSLQQYLLIKLDKNSVKPLRDQRAEYVDAIIDQLIQYAAVIQNLTNHDGWSALPDCKLSRAEQLWLDPQRAELDEAFALDRAKNDWQAVVADQFARWLNNRLKHEKLTMGDAEHSEWKKLALEVIG